MLELLSSDMANYKRIFEDGYNYFLTVVTHQRNPILISNITLLRESFAVSKAKFRYRIDAIVILPDHFHMIITPEIAQEYPKIIRSIKYHFSKNCKPEYYEHLYQSSSRNKRGMKPVWQKRYFEHTIRNEKDLSLTLEYMRQNPIKHGYTTSVREWPYSSFPCRVHFNAPK